MVETLKAFTTHYPSDHDSAQSPAIEIVLPRKIELLREFYENIGSGSFSAGLLRFFRPSRLEALSSWKRISSAREAADLYLRLIPFSSTWHGDLFCFDLSTPPEREPTIRMLEPGTGKLLKTANTFEEFICHTLIEKREAALVESFYKQWLVIGGKVPSFSQCVGYRLPLFLNGRDTVDNLEIVNQPVYIDICGSLFSQTATLPIGTSIAEFIKARS